MERVMEFFFKKKSPPFSPLSVTPLSTTNLMHFSKKCKTKNNQGSKTKCRRKATHTQNYTQNDRSLVHDWNVSYRYTSWTCWHCLKISENVSNFCICMYIYVCYQNTDHMGRGLGSHLRYSTPSLTVKINLFMNTSDTSTIVKSGSNVLIFRVHLWHRMNFQMQLSVVSFVRIPCVVWVDVMVGSYTQVWKYRTSYYSSWNSKNKMLVFKNWHPTHGAPQGCRAPRVVVP